MRLSDKDLAEFRALWEGDHPDESVSYDELRQIAIRLLRAVELVYRQSSDCSTERDDCPP